MLVGITGWLGLFWVGRDLWFFPVLDNVPFLLERHLTLADALRPHNEHIVVIHFLIYRALFDVVGWSFAPFLALNLTLHLCAAAALFTLLRRAVQPGWALALTCVFLLLGTGYQNLFWTFQAGWIAAATLGLWGLVALPSRPRLSASLLAVAVLTGTPGLYYVAAAAAYRWTRALLLPIAIYTIWFLGWGMGAVGSGQPTIAIADMPAFFLVGPAAAVGGISGVGILGGILGVSAWGAFATVRWRRGLRPGGVALAGAVGLLALYATLAVGRARYGLDATAWSRYLYLAAPLVFLAATELQFVAIAHARSSASLVIAAVLLVNLGAIGSGHDVVMESIKSAAYPNGAAPPWLGQGKATP